MTIQLKPEQEHRIAEALRSGAYSSTDDVIDRALEVLHEQDERLAAQRQETNAKIHTGIEELERGEGIPEDELDAYFGRLTARARGGESGIRVSARPAEASVADILKPAPRQAWTTFPPYELRLVRPPNRRTPTNPNRAGVANSASPSTDGYRLSDRPGSFRPPSSRN